MNCTITLGKNVEDFIYNYYFETILPNTNDGLDIPKVAYYIKKMLAELGDRSDGRSLDSISKQVESILSDNTNDILDNGNLMKLIPEEGIKNAISKTYRKINKSESIKKSIDDDEIINFFDYTFGTLFDIKKYVKNRVTRLLVNTFILNKQEGKLISSPVDMNNEAIKLKELLLHNIFGNDVTLENYKERVAKDINQLLYDINTPSKIESLYKSNIGKFNQVTDLFTLLHFDEFLEMIMGDFITPDENGYYNYKNIKNGLIDSWRTDDPDLSKEINKLTLLLIGLTPVYKKSGNTYLKINDLFITFEEFYTVMTKLKNFSSENLIDLEDATPKEWNILLGKTVSWLIDKMLDDPIQYGHLALKIISKLDTNYFTENEKAVLYSIYKGIFSEERDSDNYSLNYICSKDTKEGNLNYYNMILESVISMYPVDFLQFYENEDGSISLRNLKDLTSDNIRRSIELNILRKHTRSIDTTDDNITVTRDSTTNALKNLKYKVSETLTITRGINEYNVLGTITADKGVKNFIQNYLDINLDDELLLEYLETFYLDLKEVLKDLTKLASEVMFNKYLSQKEFANKKGAKSLQEAFNNFYGESVYKPKFNYTYNEHNLISDNSLPILDNIARAISRLTGEMATTIVKGSNGEGLNTATLGRLLGFVKSQHRRIIELNGAAAEFTVLKPGFKVGTLTTKDFKGQLENKEVTNFSVAEFLQSYFIHGFVGRNIKDRNKKIVGNGLTGMLPSVNSDKNTISFDIYNMNFEIEGTSIENLSTILIYQILCKELVLFYRKLEFAVITDLGKLSILLREKGGNNILVKGEFDEFNFWVETEHPDKTPYQYLLELCIEYNTKNPTDTINLIDQIHFVNKGGYLYTNNTRQALLERYSDPAKFHSFMLYKFLDMLEEMVSEGVQIDLNNDLVESQILKSRYPDWVGKTQNGREINNGLMTLAKVTYGNKSAKITSKYDLEEFKKQVGITNIRDLQVLVHPELERYNALDYWLTQESQLAGVGSHVGHPSKFKLKTGAIYRPSINSYDGKLTQEMVDANPDIIYVSEDTSLQGIIPITELDLANFHEIRTAIQNNRKLGKKIVIHSVNENTEDLLDDYYDFSSNFINFDDYLADSLENPETVFKELLSLAQQRNKILVTSREELALYCNQIEEERLLNIVEENEISEEANRFLALVKRNVSWTAAMHMFLPNQLDGTPIKCNFAVVDDVIFNLYTIHGNTETTKPTDGATFVSPLMMYWQNAALNGAKAGVDIKPYIHLYDERTGAGGNVKTAGFALTNTRIRNDKFYRIMSQQMMSRDWFLENGNPFYATEEVNLTVDYLGNDINYGTFYFKKGSKFYERELRDFIGEVQLEDGSVLYNVYEIQTREVTKEGIPINEPVTELIVLNNNYSVWQMFGGYNSMTLNNGVLEFSENSLLLTVKASNNFGKAIPGVEIKSQNLVWLPMKHSEIHYMPTAGAMKFGAANINSNKILYSEKEKLNWMYAYLYGGGILLDKEHSADNSVLSLMTQVVSGAAAKGYTLTLSSNLYKGLYELTKLNTANFRNELGNITTDKDQFDAAVSHLILKHIIKNTSSTDGDLLLIIALDLIELFKEDKTLKLTKEFASDVDAHIPYSDSRIYKKVINVLQSTLTKQGIKQKIPGALCVLNPTQDIIKFYKVPIFDLNNEIIGYKKIRYGKLLDYFEYLGVSSELEVLNKLQEYSKYVSLAQVEIGRYYKIYRNDGTYEVIKLEMPHSILANGKVTREGIRMYGYADLKNDLTIAAIQEYIVNGEDLQAYNVRFKDIKGNLYQLYDLDILQDYFQIHESLNYAEILDVLNKYGKLTLLVDVLKRDLSKDNISVYNIYELPQMVSENLDEFNTYLINQAKKVLNRYMQVTLNGISKNSSMNTVIIGDNKILIDKSTIETQAYGCVAPKVFRNILGLTNFDTVEDIKSDPNFFTKKLSSKLLSKINSYLYDDVLVQPYHLELKRTNGNHVYIRIGLEGNHNLTKLDIQKQNSEDGIFRIDALGNVLYQLSSIDDSVYIDEFGNEVIITDSPQFYLDKYEYDSVYLNKYNNDTIYTLLLQNLQNSENSVANMIYSLINDDKTISDRLNNFEDLLSLENSKNEDEQRLYKFANRLIGKKGLFMYNSFLKTLHLIAARIPAQNLQSFMAMELLDFEENDVNSAYVSSFLFFLQGSDLKIIKH